MTYEKLSEQLLELAQQAYGGSQDEYAKYRTKTWLENSKFIEGAKAVLKLIKTKDKK